MIQWTIFNQELMTLGNTLPGLLAKLQPMDKYYDKWYRSIEDIAWRNIGKTTIRARKTEPFSTLIEQLREEKRDLKASLKVMTQGREEAVKSFKELQKNLREQILLERTEKMKIRMSTLAQDSSKNTFWRERRKLKREPVKKDLTVKDENGIRQLVPSNIIETMASYYENLYKIKPTRWHPIHAKIQTDIYQFQTNLEHENEWFNIPPTEEQIMDTIERKKNGKATTDLKNEMLKRAKTGFTKVITPLIEHIWETELMEPGIDNQPVEGQGR